MMSLRSDVGRAFVAAAAVALAACSGTSGKDGEPCTVTKNTDGSSTIKCPDGTTVNVTNGTTGTTGQDGTDGTNGTNGANGNNGTSCTVTSPDAGLRVITCTDGTTATVTNGTNGSNGISCTLATDAGIRVLTCTDGTQTVVPTAVVDWATLTATEIAALDLRVTVSSITNVARPVVTFWVKDAKGNGVKNIPVANFSGISLLQLVPGDATNGLGNDTWVSHIANCATCTASSETASSASLADVADGSYRYTFVKDIINPTALPDGGSAIAGVAFDANAPHKFGLRLAQSGNPFRPIDLVYEYVPATGANVTGQNDKVNTGNCLTCHQQWRATANNAGGVTPFHSGQRYEAQYCVVCHNDQRKYSGNSAGGNAVIAEPTIDGSGNMTPPTGRTSVSVVRGEAVINLPVWAHKIHMGKELYLHGPYAGLGAEINEITFPQNPSNCATCHSNAAKAANWNTRPSRRACGSCHDQVDFATGVNHPGGMQTDDTSCAMSACHTSAKIIAKHLPVEPPDPNNLKANGTNANTNASFLGIRSNPPPGAEVFRYDIPTGGATTLDAGTGLRAQLKLKYVRPDGGSVAFNTWDGGNEMLDNFIGSPSVYCAYSVPQDGIDSPADFNATASVYLRNAWKNSGATMTGPDSQGYYTVTLTGATIPYNASMLTCGVGYSYSLSTTMPMTQTDLTAYPYSALTDGGYGGLGGLGVPVQNVWLVASGFTGRRGATSSNTTSGRVVDPAKCNNCHNQLGVGPSFHAGQRNEPSTCGFCHNPNRASSGWSAGSGSFIHAIHGSGKRTVEFNWHALSDTENFSEVTFPGRPQMCEGCHNAGMYDFSNSWYSQANQERRLFQTVATGRFNGNTLLVDGGTNTARWSLSPYIAAGNTGYDLPDGGFSAYDYGSGYTFAVDAGYAVPIEAAATTLVNSPITNSCSGCHDSDLALLHMKANGGFFYAPRSTAVGAAATTREQCMICHGPGKVAAIKDIHYQ
jgi:OmcA/MtrC family decaheme c-type cytochrome